MTYDYFNLIDEIMYKDHRLDDNLPICNSLDMNYFRKYKLVFKSRTMLLAYIDYSLKKGMADFCFQIDGKFRMDDIVNDISNHAAKIMANQGQRGIRVQ